jgi:hypothetical protein
MVLGPGDGLKGCAVRTGKLGVRRQRRCHFYFAHRVLFLSCADMPHALIKTHNLRRRVGTILQAYWWSS